ncbi:hypothetical protein [Caballeronia sp. J97]|uniref:hypothetical protein n=1 Tax=Caballeronia sp. J97 TaxID=2805429 RepID=UPI002AB30C55|nr:hypothetical protein [Caballeronia sp. J97]
MKVQFAAFAALALTLSGVASAKNYDEHYKHSHHDARQYQTKHYEYRDTHGHDMQAARNGEQHRDGSEFSRSNENR